MSTLEVEQKVFQCSSVLPFLISPFISFCYQPEAIAVFLWCVM